MRSAVGRRDWLVAGVLLESGGVGESGQDFYLIGAVSVMSISLIYKGHIHQPDISCNN